MLRIPGGGAKGTLLPRFVGLSPPEKKGREKGEKERKEGGELGKRGENWQKFANSEFFSIDVHFYSLRGMGTKHCL